MDELGSSMYISKPNGGSEPRRALGLSASHQVKEETVVHLLKAKPRSLRVQVRHPSDHLPLISRMDLQLLKQSRARPSLRRRPFSRSPIINIPVRFIHELEKIERIRTT
jgi:hypothetical protein